MATRYHNPKTGITADTKKEALGAQDEKTPKEETTPKSTKVADAKTTVTPTVEKGEK